MEQQTFRPDHVPDYFKKEAFSLTLVTVTGLIYNVGLLAGPWFEGKLAEGLLNVLKGSADFSSMLRLAIFYVITICLVQAARYFKRFYVRHFANNVNRRMKRVLYANIIRMPKAELEKEGAGSIMTKAVSDVDDCAEGMRKFTTEVFDTGVALIAYIGMLLFYDWRLALLCLIFPPISYILAEKMKTLVQKTGAAFKSKTGILSAATLDRTANALTYRVYGCEEDQNEAYEEKLKEYEKAAVHSDIFAAALPPLYQVISMASVLFIFYFGARNIYGTGWTAWTIASFTTFLSCYTKMSVKSSKAAKLFNSVHKAEVSWKRIKPFLKEIPEEEPVKEAEPASLTVKNLSFTYPDGTKIFEGASFIAEPGDIIGVTGPVASGKSTLGKAFLCEFPYAGSICFAGAELKDLPEALRRGIVAYLGHDPELFNDTVKNNVLLGDELDLSYYLKQVSFDREVSEMEKGEDTLVGNGGIRLSGGQAQRLALARTLAHKKPVLVLDDPFSALDRNTEKEIFASLKREASDCIVILISHRLYLFPEFDKVLWMENGRVTTGTHESLYASHEEYRLLYDAQDRKGGSHEE